MSVTNRRVRVARGEMPACATQAVAVSFILPRDRRQPSRRGGT